MTWHARWMDTRSESEAYRETSGETRARKLIAERFRQPSRAGAAGISRLDGCAAVSRRGGNVFGRVKSRGCAALERAAADLDRSNLASHSPPIPCQGASFRSRRRVGCPWVAVGGEGRCRAARYQPSTWAAVRCRRARLPARSGRHMTRAGLSASGRTAELLRGPSA